MRHAGERYRHWLTLFRRAAPILLMRLMRATSALLRCLDALCLQIFRRHDAAATLVTAAAISAPSGMMIALRAMPLLRRLRDAHATPSGCRAMMRHAPRCCCRLRRCDAPLPPLRCLRAMRYVPLDAG